MKKISFLLFSLLLIVSHSKTQNQIKYDKKTDEKMVKAVDAVLFNFAIGDAQGRVTEFIKSTDAIFKRYPKGISTFKDFCNSDWENIPQNEGIAPYTDDTGMALLVLQALIESKENNWNLNQTMDAIAKNFIQGDYDKEFGWRAPYREPGGACKRGVDKLKKRVGQHNIIRRAINYLQNFFGRKISVNSARMKKRWWDVNALQAGGCGSVMRTYPFGLIFYNDPEKAKIWAVEHSKITHGNPMALAACAAMAVGTAYAMQNNLGINPCGKSDIIQKMIEAAQEYDQETADKMRDAFYIARKGARPYLENVFKKDIKKALQDKYFRNEHDNLFMKYQGWAAHDAIAATVYIFQLYGNDAQSALYTAVHTPGDSDSLGCMVGALVGAFNGSTVDEYDREHIEGKKHFYKLTERISRLFTLEKILDAN